ncbi:hypothetical protein ABMA70_14020 [Halobacteriovorax sp. XZX-3]|uniref:hypothetical protein n=1 Tax=unclassified Halobacteriovorax TaxID=2639665 RepID=UPI0037222415
MKKNIALAIFMLGLGLSNAQAEEKKTTTDKKDIDEEITNARMRAESGSKSPLSMSLSLGYNGGSLDDPFGKERPNIYADPENETETSMSGSISGRYRLSKNDSITVGAGYSVLTPFHHAKGDISNPYIGYSRVYTIAGIQTITSADLTFGTKDSYKNQNLDQILGVSQYMMKKFGDSGWTLGASVSASFYFSGGLADSKYRADFQAKTGQPFLKDYQTEMAIGLYPQLEYVFNDTFSFRTVFGYFNYQKSRGKDAKLLRAYEYQSVGVGISVTRDIYLYPNIQFLADDFDKDKTNFGFSATINLF